MLQRIGVALAAIALLVPLTVVAQKGGRSSSHSSRSSSTKTTKASVPKKSSVAKRNSNGKIKRSASARADFMKQTGYPKGRKGYVVDHIVPLECGGADVPSNMQWQTVQEARSRTEAKEIADENKFFVNTSVHVSKGAGFSKVAKTILLGIEAKGHSGRHVRCILSAADLSTKNEDRIRSAFA